MKGIQRVYRCTPRALDFCAAELVPKVGSAQFRFSSIDMKTIIFILAAIATMSFAMRLDAEEQRLPAPEGQADSRTPLPAQFRVSVEKGIITLTDVNSGKVIGRTTFERWGVVTPTQDKLRHVALDVTAAVVAGNGSREHSVNPLHKVYTVADHEERQSGIRNNDA